MPKNHPNARVKLTRAMIEAGVAVLADQAGVVSKKALAARVFIAMTDAREVNMDTVDKLVRVLFAEGRQPCIKRDDYLFARALVLGAIFSGTCEHGKYTPAHAASPNTSRRAQ